MKKTIEGKLKIINVYIKWVIVIIIVINYLT